MPGVFCARCNSKVILEQDDKSCSNCGAQLVTPIPPEKQRRQPAPQRAPATSTATKELTDAPHRSDTP